MYSPYRYLPSSGLLHSVGSFVIGVLEQQCSHLQGEVIQEESLKLLMVFAVTINVGSGPHGYVDKHLFILSG
jgi:hypothetical protein